MQNDTSLRPTQQSSQHNNDLVTMVDADEGEVYGNTHYASIEPLPTTFEDNADTEESHKVSEYVLFCAAGLVIVAILFGFKALGALGIAIFFIYGFGLITISAFGSIRNAYRVNRKVYATVLLLILVPVFFYLANIALFMGYAISMVLGFVEPPEINS